MNENMNKTFVHIVFVLAVVFIVFGAAAYAVASGWRAQEIALVGFVSFGTIVVLFAAVVLYKIAIGEIKMEGIISEPRNTLELNEGEPKASLSRFQFLVFTFVVAGLFLMLSIEAGHFVNIPNNVLVLIGLSGGSYLISKASVNTGRAAPPPPTTDGTAQSVKAKDGGADDAGKGT